MSEEKKTGGSIRLHLKRGKDFSLDVEFELNQAFRLRKDHDSPIGCGP